MSGLTRLFGSGRRRLPASAAAVLLLVSAGCWRSGSRRSTTRRSLPLRPRCRRRGAGRGESPATRRRAPRITRRAEARRRTVADATTPPSTHRPPTGRAVAIPTAISIPEIGVHHTLIQLGQNSDGTIQTPPLTDPSIPGWYRYSPRRARWARQSSSDTSTARPAPRASSTTWARCVPVTPSTSAAATTPWPCSGSTASTSTPRAPSPPLTVYGNTTNPQLRLITCAGPFENQHYLDDIVVYASLTATHPA